VSNKKTTWYYVKKDLRDFFNPRLWLFALATSFIANVISYFTGFQVEFVIAAIFGIILILLFSPMVVYVVKCKLNKRKL
jgi:membrane protein implicated in regulation of membrane protease activity